MTTYLLIISLILHLGTILWIVVLMQKINQPTQNTEPIDAKKITREIEDLLVAYTAEMKADNERLVKELKTQAVSKPIVPMQESTHREIDVSEENMIKPLKVTQDPITSLHIEKKETVDSVKLEAEENRFPSYEPPTVTENQSDAFEQSDTLKVLTLAKQGLNVDEIAKKLNMGKGEVELLLKFYQ